MNILLERGGRSARIVAGALALAAALRWPAPAPGAERPQFTGTWQRNRDLSQDAEMKIEKAAGPEGSDASQIERQRFRQILQSLAKAGLRLEIEQKDQEFKVVHGVDEVRIFYMGREHTRLTAAGLKIRALSRWKGDDIVIDEEVEDGSRITEIYTLLPGGRQMAHMLRWESRLLNQPLLVRSVYDRVGK